MISFQTFLYDHKVLTRSPLGLEKYHELIKKIKQQLNIEKIIFEKIPEHITDKNLIINRNRLVTETNDKLIIFAVGNPNIVSTLWYKAHNQMKHISIFNGKAIVLNPPLGLFDVNIKNSGSNLFSTIICDFQFYNIQKFNERHNLTTNFTLNYQIL